jgi:hypothetical protein
MARAAMTGTARSSVVALLLLLTAGCARNQPETPVSEPKTVAARPATPRTAAKPAAPATPKPAAAARPAPVVKAAAAPLNLKALTQQLRDTKAIGIFTKIALKNQVDDLLDSFRKHYQGNEKLAMADLRRSFDLLMMKVLSLLQDEDQKLASAIVSSREAIWGMLADPKKFATLEV